MTTDLRELFPGSENQDEKSVNALLKAIKENYENGQFDYLHFKKSVASLGKMNMDEAMAVKSAFATASTLGLTKDALLRSARKYIYALETEKENFAEAVLGQKASQIDGRKSEVVEMAKKIEQNKIKIKELEREIQIFQQRIDNVDQDVEEARAKIQKTQDKFMKAFEAISTEIQTDIESIGTHL